ncbi:hypothetical protein K435DRAFT_679968, partial [Dendrothele bispora CBS 962.96]
DEAVVEELHLKESPLWMKIVQIIGIDQLSLARLRSLLQLRAGKEGGYSGFGWCAWFPGLFHTKMAEMTGFFLTHWGTSDSGTKNPGSLSFHNNLLRRLPISLTSLPTFRVCRDLTYVSLYARILHCLLIVSDKDSLDAYAHSTDWITFQSDTEAIYNQFANTTIVDDLRQCRNTEQEQSQHRPDTSSKVTEGDMVFENAVLFMRDALLSREFADAIKVGDSGRILLVLRIWALSFRGNGRSKYAYEMLSLIHNLTSVWPKGIRNIVLKNWLVNTSGRSNGFIEADLLQEHLNYWIKTIYKAHGSNSTWEWLFTISPCIAGLRDLADEMGMELGEKTQGTRHAPPDLSKDIQILMDSLAEHEVYKVKKGRTLSTADDIVTDVITVGVQLLLQGSTSLLDEYNLTFKRLQRRSRVKPVIGESDHYTTTEIPVGPETRPQPDSDIDLPPTDLDEETTYDYFTPTLAEILDGEDEPLVGLETAEDVALDMDLIEVEVDVEVDIDTDVDD